MRKASKNQIIVKDQTASQLTSADQLRSASQRSKLAGALALWTDQTTDASSARRADLLRDKQRALLADDDALLAGSPRAALAFFDYCGKPVERVTALDVKEWQAALESAGYSPATVYAKVSRLSSFYAWAMQTGSPFANTLTFNPVTLARPKAPKAYQNESAKALDDDEALALLAHVKALAGDGDLIAMRDYALLVFYFDTGWRRREVMQLRFGDVKVNGGLTVRTQAKGGLYKSVKIVSQRVKLALLDYLRAAGRLDTMTPDSPLWTSHSVNATGEQALTSHAFVKRLKAYALAAGVGAMHLHQTRHTYARIVAEESGSMTDVQTALGHASIATTRAYVQTIVEREDKFGSVVAGRLDV